MSVFEELCFHKNNAKFLIFWATKWFKMHVPETMHPWWVYPIRNKLGRQGSVPVLKQIPYGHRGTGYLVSNPSGVWCFIRKKHRTPEEKVIYMTLEGSEQRFTSCTWCLHHYNRNGETYQHTEDLSGDLSVKWDPQICAKHKWMERMWEIHRFTCTDTLLHPHT